MAPPSFIHGQCQLDSVGCFVCFSLREHEVAREHGGHLGEAKGERVNAILILKE